jgi:hypothetical protein
VYWGIKSPEFRLLQSLALLFQRELLALIIDSPTTICECFALYMQVFAPVLMFGRLYKFLFATGDLRLTTASVSHEVTLLGVCCNFSRAAAMTEGFRKASSTALHTLLPALPH